MANTKSGLLRTPKVRTGKKHRGSGGIGSATKSTMGKEFSTLYTAFPYARNCILPAVKKITLASTLAGTTTQDQFGDEWVFRLNSIFAPQFTAGAGANRVLGYTQVAALYKRYKVVGVVVDIEVYDPDQDGMVVGIGYQPGNATQQLAGVLIDDIDAKQGYYVASFSNTGSQKKHFKKFIPMYRLLGLTKAQFAADTFLYSSDIGSSPNQVPFLRIAVASTANATNSFARAIIRIEYHTRLYDKIVEDQTSYTAA